MPKHTSMFLLLFVGACLTSIASSQELLQELDGLDNVTRARIIRTEYRRTPDLPDALSLYSILNMVSGINAESRQAAVSFTQSRMGLSISESDQFVDYLVAKFESFNADRVRMVKSLACPSDRPRPSGDQIYAVFEAIDDARLALLMQYLATIKAELDGKNAGRFQAWLQRQKLSTVQVTYRHKEAYKHYELDAEMALDTMCQ